MRARALAPAVSIASLTRLVLGMRSSVTRACSRNAAPVATANGASLDHGRVVKAARADQPNIRANAFQSAGDRAGGHPVDGIGAEQMRADFGQLWADFGQV